MLNKTRLDMNINALAGISLTFGLIGVVTIALVYMQIVTSSHFDLVIRDNEYFLVLGFALFVTALSLVDLGAGLSALHRLKEPHAKYTKPMAIAGITLGIADITPALAILMVMIGTLL